MRKLQANMRGLSCCTVCRKEFGWCSQYYVDTKTRKLYCPKCNQESKLGHIIISEWRRMRGYRVFHIPYFIRHVFRKYTGKNLYD